MAINKKFDEKIWLEFGKKLIDKRRLEEQRKFLEHCKSREIFLTYMDKNITSKPNSIVGDTDVTLVLDREAFSEQEFINLSTSGDEQKIWTTFQSAGSDVLLYGFWGYVTLDIIKKKYIQPSFLARTGNGIKTIDEALKSNASPKKIDSTVRRILRSMCNPAPRGKRVIFNECYLGKSYWRWHWANKMSLHIELSPEQIRKVLNTKSYAVFAQKMHTGKSYIGSERLLGGLLMYMNESKPTTKKLEKIINQISYLSIWKALEMQNPLDNQKTIQEIVDRL